MCGVQRGGPPLDCQEESPKEIIQFPAVKHVAGTSGCCTTDEIPQQTDSNSSKSCCQEFTGHFYSNDSRVVTSVFKKFSRVLTRLDIGVKSTR